MVELVSNSIETRCFLALLLLMIDTTDQLIAILIFIDFIR